MCCRTWGTQPIYCNKCKWIITFKNCTTNNFLKGKKNLIWQNKTPSESSRAPYKSQHHLTLLSFFFNNYLFGCVRSQLQQEGSFIAGSDFSLVVSCRLSCPAYGIFVHQAGIEPHVPYIARQILNHWTTREVPILTLLFILPVHLLIKTISHPFSPLETFPQTPLELRFSPANSISSSSSTSSLNIPATLFYYLKCSQSLGTLSLPLSPPLSPPLSLPLSPPKQSLLGASMRHSARGKGHEERGSTYAKVGSSLRSPPGNPRASTPITRACLLYYFVLSPTLLTLRGAVPHHLFRRRS